jgi:anti-anti-sigma factor
MDCLGLLIGDINLSDILKIELIEAEGSKLFVKLNGELDHISTAELRGVLNEKRASEFEYLVFDMEEVFFMASCALGIFAFYLDIFKMRNSNQHLSIINCQQSVMRLFELTKMTEYMDISGL